MSKDEAAVTFRALCHEPRRIKIQAELQIGTSRYVIYLANSIKNAPN